ncbi:hypothetical protein KR222_007014 [Zaprionus bogoriensis]|nr:hypothetical protein KR222_007014 [Zaprionus bogoriensis]
MHEFSAKLAQTRRKYNDLYSEVKSWLNAPNLSALESKERRETLQMRLLMLDKIDEEYYIRRYIKLRTR